MTSVLVYTRRVKMLSNSGWCLQPDLAQPERIGNHRYRTQGHGRTGDHRAEKNTKEWLQQTRGDGNAQRVVNEGQEQILTDVLHGEPAEATGSFDASKIAANQGDSGTLDCHIGAASHSNSDLGLGQSGRVVNAIAGHRYSFALSLQFLDDIGLLI